MQPVQLLAATEQLLHGLRHPEHEELPFTTKVSLGQTSKQLYWYIKYPLTHPVQLLLLSEQELQLERQSLHTATEPFNPA